MRQANQFEGVLFWDKLIILEKIHYVYKNITYVVNFNRTGREVLQGDFCECLLWNKNDGNAADDNVPYTDKET